MTKKWQTILRNISALALCFSMAMSMAACGPAGGKEAEPSTDKATEEKTTDDTKAEEKTTDETATTDTEESPAAGDKPVLKVAALSLVCISDYETNTFTKMLEEKANVDLQFTTVPSQGKEEKVQIMLSSGDIPDILISLGLNDSMLTKYGVDEQMFLPLDDLIEANAVNLKASIGKFERGFDTLRMKDGHLYSMPVLDVCQHCEHASKMWVNSGWTDKLGIAMPTTTDEFRDMLTKFKSGDPNGNGKADELPLVGSNPKTGWHNSIDEFLLNSFLYYDRTNFGIIVKDGVVMNAITEEDYKEGLKYLKTLYTEGLLYENSMTQDQENVVKLTENPDADIVGASAGGFVGMIANMGSERGVKFRPLTPLKGPKGFQNTATYPSLPQNGNFVISADCENPEAAVKMADLMYDPEFTLDIRAGGNMDNFWRYAKDGELDFDGNPAKWFPIKPWQDKDPQNESWIEVGVWDFTDLRAAQATDSSVDLWSLAGNEYMLYKVTKEQYKPYATNCSLPPIQFDVDEQEKIATGRTELETLMNSSQFNFISGTTDIDAEWDKYVKDVKTISDPLVALYQKGYDAQYGK